MNKRGQIAIFVIIALIIAGVVIAIFAFPQLRDITAPREINPVQYLQDCIEPEIKAPVELLAKQGGDENPVGYITYKGTNIKYLCYVTGYYKTCVIQQPMLMTHFAEELSRILTPKAERCAENLINEYKDKGYSVSAEKINSSVLLTPGKIKIQFFAPMTITKETTRTFEKFDVEIESGIYDLLAISTSIVEYEATLGDAEITAFTPYYPNINIEKIKLEDGIKIYKLTEVVKGDSFTFATRSLVWPAGWGI